MMSVGNAWGSVNSWNIRCPKRVKGFQGQTFSRRLLSISFVACGKGEGAH